MNGELQIVPVICKIFLAGFMCINVVDSYSYSVDTRLGEAGGGGGGGGGGRRRSRNHRRLSLLFTFAVNVVLNRYY